jgi:hypothetical protein
MTLAEKISTPIDVPNPLPVAGRTTEAVLRDLAASPDIDPLPTINALVARYDAKAIRRASKAEAASA